jgi:hypothetical protein
VLTGSPSTEVITGAPQLSVAVAFPAAGNDCGLQPRLLPGGQKVNTGGTASVTVIVLQQVTAPSVQTIVTHKLKLPQLVPEFTVTDEPVVEPTIVAPEVLFVNVQLYAGEVQAVASIDAE